jgi:prevent-host-death family protein
MDWCAAEAKEKAKSKLSEVLGEAKKETQKIRNRGKPIAAVVSI